MHAKQEGARQAYHRGAALVREQRFAEAITELRLAGDLYRRLDERGHAFNYTLENGISGLGNSLYQLGICYEMTGQIPEAVAAFETCTINERYERAAPYRTFLLQVNARLSGCYEQLLHLAGGDVALLPLPSEPAIDVSFAFPFSLEKSLIPAARLFELNAVRHARFSEFYRSAQQRDAALRRASSRTDDSAMRSISIGVWSVLALIWIAYGFVVLHTLMEH